MLQIAMIPLNSLKRKGNKKSEQIIVATQNQQIIAVGPSQRLRHSSYSLTPHGGAMKNNNCRIESWNTGFFI